MATIDLTEADFETTITSHEIVLIDFWAAWCGPCRQFAPVFTAASEKHPDIVFAKVDTEAERGLAGAARVTSIPTLMAFRGGVLVFSQPGALSAPALEQVIDAVRGLDMAQVHSQVAKQRELADKPREVTLEQFAGLHADGAPVIDVREPSEYAAGHVPGATLVPLRQVPEQLGDLPDGPLYVICATGNRSLQAADYLRANGIEAYSVAGGTSAWQRGGGQIVTGAEPVAQRA